MKHGWRGWRTTARFSFQGKHGHLSLLKETRRRSKEGYWYAYRRQGKRRIKQYAGRTLDLTISRLEELAHTSDVSTTTTHSFRRITRQDSQEQSVDEIPSQVWQERSGYEVSPQAQRKPALPPGIIQGPLLAARLCPPPLSAALISRERLLALLVLALSVSSRCSRLRAGSGKTTLLTQWLAARGWR